VPNVSTNVRRCFIEAQTGNRSVAIGSELYADLDWVGIVAVDLCRLRGRTYDCELSAGGGDECHAASQSEERKLALSTWPKKLIYKPEEQSNLFWEFIWRFNGEVAGGR
jgi:hypothetical protein